MKAVNSFFFVLFISVGLQAQSKLKDFTIIIEKTKDGIHLQSNKGTAWTNLSFSLNNYHPQIIDEFGMVKYDETSKSKDSNYADFLFTISKVENEIILKGKQGTAWKDLSFTLVENEKQGIDQFGMTKLK